MDDLAGRLLAAQETGGDKWEVAYYPAFAEQEEPFRKIGDPLHPERYSAQELRAIESALGSYTFAALYQQHPMPREGGMFKRRWFGEPVPAAPISRQVVRSWDLAATDSGGDWTVGVKMSKADSGMFYIEHIERFRGSSLDVETAVLNYAKVHDGRRVTVRLPQDAGQAGKGQVAAFARQLAGQHLDIIRETGSKEVRASPFAAQCEAGNVKLVAGPWNNDFLAELETFPMGTHDDQVDAAAGAFTTLCESPRMVISEEALQRAGVNPLVSRMRRR
jgi:predicted phage terminase large subunit-like protein